MRNDFPLFSDADFKASLPCHQSGKCVLVAAKDGIVAIRDSKDFNKTTLRFDHEEWIAFLAGVKRGQFDV